MICLHVNPSRRPLDEVIMTPCTFYWVASRHMMETIWNLIGALFTQKMVPLRFVRMKGVLSAKLWDGFWLFRWTTAPLLFWNCSISTTNPPCLNLSSWLVGLCIFLAGWRVCVTAWPLLERHLHKYPFTSSGKGFLSRSPDKYRHLPWSPKYDSGKGLQFAVLCFNWLAGLWD